MNRFFLPKPFIKGENHPFPDEEMRHAKVKRLRVGEKIELINGKGQLTTASYGASVEIEEVQEFDKILPHTILIQALAEPEHLDTIIEKGTELGIGEFWLFPASKSLLKELSPGRQERLQRILISAIKQCGRYWIPTIRTFPSLKELPRPEHLILTVPGGAPFKMPTSSTIASIIGPESGLTESEISFIKTHLKPDQYTSLSHHILRAETAAISASFLMNYTFS